MRSLSAAALLLVAPIALGAQATPAKLDVSKIHASRDSFVIMVQGQEMGYQVAAVEKTADGLRLTSDKSIMNGMIASKGEVLVGADNAMRSIKSNGVMQGQTTSSDIAFAAGHAKGKAIIPGMGGLEEKAIDVDVPAGIPDQSMLTSILTTLPLAQGAKFSLPMFNTITASVDTLTLEVTGAESVTVPAGTFEAWIVNLAGTGNGMNLFVSKANPRVLKLALVGQPVELVLAK